MAEDLHKDNLEDFFKGSFEKQSDLPAEDGWDTPSDQVWAGIDQAINKDDSDKGVVWLTYLRNGLLILVLSIIGIALALYFMPNQIENLEQESTSIEAKVLNSNDSQSSTSPSLTDQNTLDQQPEGAIDENLPTNVDADSKEISGNETNKTSPVFLNNESKNLAPKESTSNSKKADLRSNDDGDEAVLSSEKSKALNNNSEEGDRTIKSEGSEKAKINPSKSSDKPVDMATYTEGKDTDSASKNVDEDKTQEVVSSNDMNPSIDEPQMPFSVLEELPTIATLNEVNSAFRDTMELSVSPFTDLKRKEKTTDSKAVSGFYAGLSIAPSYTSRQIKVIGNPVIPRDLNKIEMGDFSFSTGVNLGYKLSKNWSVESGFNYSKLSFQHNGRRQVRYTAVGEQINDRGEFERDYNFNLSTSSGEVDTDIALAREAGTDIPENEFIALQIQARQNIQYGSIPLITRYQFGKGKFQFGLKAGLVNRFLLEGTFRIEDVSVARSGIRLVLNDRIYRSRPLKKFKKISS